MVLGLARAFAAAGGSSRTLVFALFGAEELGLIGSRHYVNRPVVPLDRTVAMVNFDMVGRLQGRSLNVGGGDSGNRLRKRGPRPALGAERAAPASGDEDLRLIEIEEANGDVLLEMRIGLQELPGRGLPQAHGAIDAAAGYQSAIAAHRHAPDCPRVPVQGGARLAAPCVPQADPSVHAAAGQKTPVLTEPHAMNRSSVALKSASGLTAPRLP